MHNIYLPIIIKSPRTLPIGVHAYAPFHADYTIQDAPVRLPICWGRAEISPGVYNWAEIDALIDAFSEHEILASIKNTPIWARKYPYIPSSEPLQQYWGNYVNFVGEFNQRYNPYRMEVWNEPDVPKELCSTGTWYMGCWGNTYEDGVRYGQFFNLVAQTVDPNKLLAGALMFEVVEFARGMLDTIVPCAGMSYHCYGYYVADLTRWNTYYNKARSLTDLPLYVTETSLLYNNATEELEQEQANYLDLLSKVQGIERIYWLPVVEKWTWKNSEMIIWDHLTQTWRKKPAWYMWNTIYSGAN